MSRITLSFITLLIIEIFVIIFIVDPRWTLQVYGSENSNYESVLGKQFTSNHRDRTTKRFNKWFVRSGVVKQSFDTFVATDEQRRRSRGMEDMGNGMQQWMYERLKSFWTQVKIAMFRFSVLAELMMYAVLIYIPVLIDGLTQRSINAEAYEYASPTYFHMSKKLLTILILTPFLFLIFPGALHPWFVLGWMLIFPIPIWLGAKNVQHKI